MAFNIVTPIAAGDAYEATKAKLVTVAETWLGSGQASGGNTPATWADMRTKLNLILAAFGKTTIGSGDNGAVARSKINGIINAEALLSGTTLAWWNADRADLVSLSGSNVTAWADSISGYSAAQGNSSFRPVYSATSFNGSPGLTFDATDDCLEMASQPFPSGSNGSEIWAVAQQDALAADATTRVLFSFGGDSNLSQIRSQRQVSGGINRNGAAYGLGASANGAVETTITYSTRHLSRVRVTSSLCAVSTDSSAETLSGAGTPATGTSRVRIGASANTTAGSFWNGKIRDVLVTSPLSGDAPTYLRNFLLLRRAL